MNKLEDFIKSNNITMVAEHLYVNYDDENFPVDVWNVSLNYEDRSATFSYKTGIGNRKLSSGVDRVFSQSYYYNGKKYNNKSAIKNNLLTLKDPNVADVLECLLLDFRLGRETFDDFCSEFGYDKDSISHMFTYLTMQRNGSKLVKLLGYGLVEKLQACER